MQGPILIIDDHPDMRELLLISLGFIDEDITAVGSPDEALSYIRRRVKDHNPPRIIISDIALRNGIDGWALARKIREIERSPENKGHALSAWVMVSGYSQQEADKPMQVLSDVYAVVEKPIVDWEKFRATLRSAYQRRFAAEEMKTMGAPSRGGQMGGSWFSDKELMFAVVAVIWMLFTAVEMTLQWNQKAQIIKNEEQIISNQRLQILRIDDTREDLASYGMLNKNGPFGHKEEKK